jgi:hypothetical protein
VLVDPDPFPLAVAGSAGLQAPVGFDLAVEVLFLTVPELTAR